MPEPPRFDPDLEWLDLVRPVGLVVAPSLLKELGLTPELQTSVVYRKYDCKLRLR